LALEVEALLAPFPETRGGVLAGRLLSLRDLVEETNFGVD